jgi:hypothetical protein
LVHGLDGGLEGWRLQALVHRLVSSGYVSESLVIGCGSENRQLFGVRRLSRLDVAGKHILFAQLELSLLNEAID